MRRLLALALTLALIGSVVVNTFGADAKENAKEVNKGKSSTTTDSTPTVKSAPGKEISIPKQSSDQKPTTGSNTNNQSAAESSAVNQPSKVETSPKKTDSVKNIPVDTGKAAQNTGVSKTQGESVATKKNSSSIKADSVRDLDTPQSSACKSAGNAKIKNPQNICYDFIVVFKPGLGRAAAGKLLSDAGAQKLREYSNIFNGALVNGPLAKMQALAKNPNILVVEDDLEVKTTSIQTPSPWGLDRIDQAALPLSNSFDDKDETGASALAYVVDTGIDGSNVDFEGRVSSGFTAITDGLGSADCNGHGTHVAGTIGGKTYGVAKKSLLIPVRVLDCAGSGSYSSVISGLDWIAANYQPGQPAVVNMSLGGPTSSTLDGAVRTLISKGVTVVVAAGNSGADACNYSPARVTEAITVAATTNSDSRASYSNFGSCVDIFAPGSSITSTWLGANGTNTISGTSMATPHVVGTLARFIGFNPTLTPGQVANSLVNSATNGIVLSAGTNSPNKLLFLSVTPDTATAVPVDSSPTFKKVTPRGKKK